MTDTMPSLFLNKLITTHPIDQDANVGCVPQTVATPTP